MKKKQSFICLCYVIMSIILLSSGVESKKRKINYCTMDTFFKCLVFPLARFTHQTNGTGIPKNDAEFDELCTIFHDIQPHCVRKYVDRCGTPIWQEVFENMWIKRLKESYSRFCDRNLPIRDAFVKHAPCLIEKVKLSKEYRQECVRGFQGNNEHFLEWMLKKSHEKHSPVKIVQGLCCIYNEWENCIVKHLRQNCGDEAANDLSAGDVFPHLIHHSSIMLPTRLCMKQLYDPDNSNSECKNVEFRAPKEYVPTGINSKSYFSHFFSLSCPNVGYGIVPSRDS